MRLHSHMYVRGRPNLLFFIFEFSVFENLSKNQMFFRTLENLRFFGHEMLFRTVLKHVLFGASNQRFECLQNSKSSILHSTNFSMRNLCMLSKLTILTHRKHPKSYKLFGCFRVLLKNIINFFRSL